MFFSPWSKIQSFSTACFATGFSFMIPGCDSRRNLFQVTATAELLEQTILDYRRQNEFLLHASVVMPDHFHALITPALRMCLSKKPCNIPKAAFVSRRESGAARACGNAGGVFLQLRGARRERSHAHPSCAAKRIRPGPLLIFAQRLIKVDA